MSCSSSSNRALVTKDFMGTEESDHVEVSEFDLDKNTYKDCPKTDLKVAKDMSAIDFFRKYLFYRTQHSNGTSATKTRSPPRALLPPKPGSNLPRPISLLERELLPGGSSIRFENGATHDNSQGTQLTIFYEGAVSVFDNVTIEKAQAIMLLAGDSAFATSAVTKSPKPDQTSSPQKSNLPSICKLQAADIPIARKRSIQSFLAKRRDRITQKSPYRATDSGKKHLDSDEEEDEPIRDVKNQIFRPSPFPSRSGFFLSVPTKGHC